MQQNTIWTRFLSIGISSFFAVLCINCATNVQSRLDVDIIYKNETDHVTKYYEFIESIDTTFLLFELQTNSEKKIEMRGSGSKTTIDNCCKGILADFQGDNSIIIAYNNNKCLVYPNGTGSTTKNISTYQIREIDTGYYELTYTFTKQEYNQAELCDSTQLQLLNLAN